MSKAKTVPQNMEKTVKPQDFAGEPAAQPQGNGSAADSAAASSDTGTDTFDGVAKHLKELATVFTGQVILYGAIHQSLVLKNFGLAEFSPTSWNDYLSAALSQPALLLVALAVDVYALSHFVRSAEAKQWVTPTGGFWEKLGAILSYVGSGINRHAQALFFGCLVSIFVGMIWLIDQDYSSHNLHTLGELATIVATTAAVLYLVRVIQFRFRTTPWVAAASAFVLTLPYVLYLSHCHVSAIRNGTSSDVVLKNGALLSQVTPIASNSNYSFFYNNVRNHGLVVHTNQIESVWRQGETGCRVHSVSVDDKKVAIHGIGFQESSLPKAYAIDKIDDLACPEPISVTYHSGREISLKIPTSPSEFMLLIRHEGKTLAEHWIPPFQQEARETETTKDTSRLPPARPSSDTPDRKIVKLIGEVKSTTDSIDENLLALNRVADGAKKQLPQMGKKLDELHALAAETETIRQSITDAIDRLAQSQEEGLDKIANRIPDAGPKPTSESTMRRLLASVLFTRAVDEYAAERFPKATSLLDEAIEMNACDARLYFLRAVTYERADDSQRARDNVSFGIAALLAKEIPLQDWKSLRDALDETDRQWLNSTAKHVAPSSFVEDAFTNLDCQVLPQ